MNLPESIVAGTHYSQDRFLRSLGSYRNINTEDETVFNYFDEIEIHPIHIGMTWAPGEWERGEPPPRVRTPGQPRCLSLMGPWEDRGASLCPWAGKSQDKQGHPPGESYARGFGQEREVLYENIWIYYEIDYRIGTF